MPFPFRAILSAMLALACLAGSNLRAHAGFASGTQEEYALKAQLLVELAAYVKWPPRDHPGKTFVIAVIGRSPFGNALLDYAAGHSVQGRRIEIQHWKWPDQTRDCDMAFICSSEQAWAAEILAWSSGRGVLTASESSALTQQGVMVGLVLETGKVKIYLNRQIMLDQKFTASSLLLGLATLVGPDRPAK
jgi:hypothetical protein